MPLLAQPESGWTCNTPSAGRLPTARALVSHAALARPASIPRGKEGSQPGRGFRGERIRPTANSLPKKPEKNLPKESAPPRRFRAFREIPPVPSSLRRPPVPQGHAPSKSSFHREMRLLFCVSVLGAVVRHGPPQLRLVRSAAVAVVSSRRRRDATGGSRSNWVHRPGVLAASPSASSPSTAPEDIVTVCGEEEGGGYITLRCGQRCGLLKWTCCTNRPLMPLVGDCGNYHV